MVGFRPLGWMGISTAVTLVFLLVSINALGNGSGDLSSSYVSVRALDNYGNAVQLSHAKEAAQRYGRSVVVAVVDIVHDQNNNSTGKQPEISRANEHKEHQTESVEEFHSSSFLMVISLGNSPILHPIQLPLESDPTSLLAICFTGVKGDANWLLQQIQKYAADVWERYGTTVMSVPAVSHVVARLLGRFAAQPEDREWQSSLGLPGKHDSDDDHQSSWSRPLGVQTMILSTGVQDVQKPKLLIVEPSGRVLNPLARSASGCVSLAAMGKESDKIQARLSRLISGKEQERKTGIGPFSFSSSTRDETQTSSWEDIPPTYERCRDSLIRVLLEETTGSNTNNIGSQQNNGGGEIMVEGYSLDRGQIERQIFRYENANTFVPL
ncbi:unnamed protein product [Pseudo-nitzschia multistriata]|uniref:Proteasome assembly chaperone 2 n=1 Tax=Pseudo-nitzschia multistriata TaxID=183589 RepID=A0A448ZSF9_9STRA|nr:unnamed protein product [Pseudo-nitzschia multistriata]